MVSRKRKTCDSSTRKIPTAKIAKENDCQEMFPKLSLPVISNEKVYSDDLVKTRENSKTGGNSCKPVVPKVILKCQALRIEKIIDYENNTVTVKKLPKRSSSRQVGNKTANRKNGVQTSVTPLLVEPPQKNSTATKGTKNMTNVDCENKALALQDKNHPVIKKKVKISNKSMLGTVKPVSEQIPHPVSKCVKEQNLQGSKPRTSQDPSSSSLNNDPDPQEMSLCCLDDESAFIELGDINLNELVPSLEGISDEEWNGKSVENSTGRAASEETAELSGCQKNKDQRDKYRWDTDQVNQDLKSLGKTSLLDAVETFMKNAQVKTIAAKADLKKGLCNSWLTKKACSNEDCPYSHNALNLFIQKLKRFPSKFIMTEVVSMRSDNFFVDVVMAAFKVISERKIPVVWVTFLTFFVFYVTEPSDSRFLKFWASAARFFCELKDNFSTARGFASLLSVFSQGGKSEEWKIIEFIKLIKRPPVQVRINFALLQPVIKLNLPSEFLVEAVESSMATQNDVLNVHSLIIPKICVTKVTVRVVELLLKFCKVLEELNQKNLAVDLKQQLQRKVLSFKTKINHLDHPLAASFQEEISAGSNQENSSLPPVALGNATPTPDVADGRENNYFQPEGDFCSLLSEAINLSTAEIPTRRSKTEDACERHLTRIEQFFRECRFDLLGKYINEVDPAAVERVTKQCLKLLFQMKISLRQGVDLMKIVLLPCKSESAAKVMASISITLILNLVRIKQWKKAYTIMSLCQEKNINLVDGKVFYCKEYNAVTQCRIVLLLIEIHSYKGNYANAVDLVKKYSLFSSDGSFWKLSRKPHDETIRVKILEDLLRQIISNHLTELAYDLFRTIWGVQKRLVEAIDLRKFVDEMLILLLNQESEEAIEFYEQIKAQVELKETTVRAVVVSLVRRNRLLEAKRLVESVTQSAYFFPEITPDAAILKIFSFWLEEEIYVIFDAFFDLLIARKTTLNPANYGNIDVQLHESKSNPALDLRPLCLGFTNPSFKDACTRIQRVLQYQFSPPVKLIIMPYSLKLDVCSVRLHLQKRLSKKN